MWNRLIDNTIKSIESRKTITKSVKEEAKRFLRYLEKEVDLSNPENFNSYCKYRDYLKSKGIVL